MKCTKECVLVKKMVEIYLININFLGHCYDDIKNGDETDVDCGGSCIQCLGT